MAYTWKMGADTGGGYVGVIATDPQNPGRAVCGGDQWGGPLYTDNYGDEWIGAMNGIPSITGPPYLRAACFSQRPGNSGRAYLGTGPMQSAGGEFSYIEKGSNQYHVINSSDEFGTALSGGNGFYPRAVGGLIQTLYNPSNDTEYIFLMLPSGALVRYSCSGSGAPANRTVLNTLATGPYYKAMAIIDTSTIMVAEYFKTTTGAANTGQTHLFTASDVRTAASVGHTVLSGAPSNLTDLKVINGNVYATGLTGLFVTTPASNYNTWTTIKGVSGTASTTTFDDNVGSLDGFINGNIVTIFTGSGDPSQALPSGHAFAKLTCDITATGGVTNPSNWTFTWTSIAANISGKLWGSLWGDTNSTWWLFGTAQDPTTGSYDSSMLRIDPSNTQAVYSVGRGGCWSTRTGGSLWRPAMVGLCGSQENGISISGNTLTTNNTDWKAAVSTTAFKTATVGATNTIAGSTSFTANVTGQGSTTFTYVTTGGGDVTMKIGTGTATSIADNYFHGTFRKPQGIVADTSGNVFIAMWGGVLVGSPASGPAPLTPPVLSQPTVTGTTINASWTAATGGTSPYTYQVSYDGGTFTTPSSGTTGLTDSTTLPTGTHTLVVKVTDSASQTALSNQVTFTSSPVTAPVITFPTQGSTSSVSTLSTFWNAVTGGTAPYTYSISYDGGAFTSVGTALQTPHTFTPNGTHTVQVRATDATNATATSSVVSFTVNGLTLGAITAPTANQNFTTNAVTTTWAAATGGTPPYTYTIQYDSGAFVTPTGSLTDTTTLPNGTHTVRVKATDGTTTLITPATTFTVGGLLAGAITNPVNGSTLTASSVTSTWSAATGGTAPYTYAVSYDGGAFGAATGLSDTHLFGNGTHTVQVQATDSASNTALSSIITFTVNSGITAAVITPPPNPITTATFVTTWSAATSGAGGITYQISYDGGATYNTPTSGPTGLSDSHTFADGTYSVIVKATDANSLVAPSTTVTYHVLTTAPPPPVIDTGPTPTTGGTTTSTSAQFTFHETGNVNPVTFQGFITGGTAQTITSPMTYSNLTPGSFAFNVVAVDSVTGFQSTAATWTWTVQAVSAPPKPVITSGPTLGGTSGTQTVTITNNGNQNLVIGQLSITGTNAGLFNLLTDNASNKTVAPGASVTASVNFTPATTGTFNATLNIPNNSNTNYTIALTGQGIPAGTTSASVNPTSLAFGAVLFGQTSAAKTLTVTNTGTLPITFGTLVITGSQFALASNGVGGVTLQPNQQATVTITYTPGSSVESATGDILFPYSSVALAAQSLDVPLTGSGQASSPGIQFSSPTLNFPSTNTGITSSPLTITVRNIGTANLVMGTVTLTGANAGDYAISADGVSGHTIAPASTANISVTFTPTATGTRTASLSFPDNAAGSPQTVGITGTATGAVPVASISPTSVSFATTKIFATSANQTVTLTNTGSANLVVSKVALGGTNPGQFHIQTDNATGQTITPGGNRTVIVNFKPTRIGLQTATLAFTDNAGGSPQAIPLGGTGVVADVQPLSHTVWSYYYPSYGLSPAEGFNSETYQGWGGTFPAPQQPALFDNATRSNTIQVTDTFTRTTSGSLGSADTGQALTIQQGSTSDFATNGTQMTWTMPATEAPQATYNIDTDTLDFLYQYKFSSQPTGATQVSGPAWWFKDAANYYRVTITQTLTPNTNLIVQQQVANVNTTVGMDWGSGVVTTTKAIPTAQVNNQMYWCRLRVYPDGAGSYKFLVKVWIDGGSEPSNTPQASGTSIVGLGSDIGGAAQTHGGVGWRGQSNSGNTNTPVYTFDNVSINNAPLTFSHTVGTGANRYLVVRANLTGNTVTNTGVTYNGTSMSLIGRESTNNTVELWGLANPASGAHNVVGTLSGTDPGTSYAAVSFAQVNQTAPFYLPNTGGNNHGSGTTATSATFIGTNGDILIAGVSGTTSATLLSGQEVTNDTVGNSTAILPLNNNQQTLSWTVGSGNWAVMAAAIRAVQSVGTQTYSPPNSIASDFFPADYWSGATGYPPAIYSSSDPIALQAQCAAAIAAGINVFVVSWAPPPDRRDTLISGLLTAAQAASNAAGTPLFISFLIEPWASSSFTDPVNSTVVSGGRTAAGVWHAINYINSNYGSHPHFYRTARTGWNYAGRGNGANVFFLNKPEYDFLNNGTPNTSISGTSTFWQTANDNAHNGTNVPLGALVLAESAFSPTNANNHHFDGGFVLRKFSLAQNGQLVNSIFQFNRTWQLGFPPTAVCIPAASPGHSAWRIQDTLNRRAGRSNGTYYNNQWYDALNGVALYDIAVSSWNDWGKGTQIEPATNQTGGTGL